MPKRSSKKPGNVLVTFLKGLAAQLVGAATEPDADDPNDKNPAAVALGRLGGLKGGPARAAKLSARRRSQIAKNAALARWKKKQ